MKILGIVTDGAGQEVEVWTLADRRKAGEPDVSNSFGDPEGVAVAASRSQAASGRLSYRLLMLSLTVLRWRVNDAAR